MNMPSDDFKLIRGSQLRAARALMRWNVDDLAERSRVAVATITDAESEDGPVSVATADARALRLALETAGIEFISENSGGGGARVAQPTPPPHGGPRAGITSNRNEW